ncbi:MAG: M48 family metalloprotease, partial [Cyanobacteria bacterium]|nr:M48 family metalloprotease [Cyanobacteriota bacterium]
SKSFMVLYSDILDLAFNKGESAIEFVIAHELAHIKRGHIDKHYLLMPMILFVPFINKAYYRACEYTCDKIASTIVGQEGAKQGLAVLCLGKKLFGSLNIEDMIQSARSNSGFWAWLSEKLSTHPAMYKRLLNVQE